MFNSTLTEDERSHLPVDGAIMITGIFCSLMCHFKTNFYVQNCKAFAKAYKLATCHMSYVTNTIFLHPLEFRLFSLSMVDHCYFVT